MFNMRKAVLGAMVAVAVLAGCGGGGDDAGTPGPTDVRTKYLGQWRSDCDQTGPAASEREVITMTLQDPNQLRVDGQEFDYATTNCAGAATQTTNYGAVITMVGTKLDSTNVQVDKITIRLDGQSTVVNGISDVRNSRLFVTFYDPSVVPPMGVDGAGFPTTLDPDFLRRLP